VLITGASGSLGRELARRFASEGALLLLWDVNEDGLKALATLLVSEGRCSAGQVRTRCLDVCDPVKVAAALAQDRAEFGPVSVLVNNAAVARGHTVLDSSVEEIQQAFNVNALAHWWSVKAALPSMIAAAHGTIVTISSVMADVPSARLADYCATKAAISQLHRCLRWELKGSGVHCMLVQPFMIGDSPLFRGGAPIRYPVLRPLVPLLLASDVADAIVDGVQKRREHIVLPWFLRHLLAILPFLPGPLRDIVLDLGGAATSMDGFIGQAEQHVPKR